MFHVKHPREGLGSGRGESAAASVEAVTLRNGRRPSLRDARAAARGSERRRNGTTRSLRAEEKAAAAKARAPRSSLLHCAGAALHGVCFQLYDHSHRCRRPRRDTSDLAAATIVSCETSSGGRRCPRARTPPSRRHGRRCAGKRARRRGATRAPPTRLLL